MEACTQVASLSAVSPLPDFMEGHEGLALRCDRYLPGRTASEARDALPPVYFAHGFGQTRHAWGSTATTLAALGHSCTTLDGRGHGESGWLDGTPYALDQFVGDVRAVVAHAPRPPVWVGASMGGLVGMLAQGETEARLFDALVLVDVTPSWEPAGVERIMTFMHAHPEGFASVAEAQQAVVSYLPHRASAKSPERLRKLLVKLPNGRLRWHWDPRLLEVARDAPGWGARLQAAAARLRIPVLLVSGGRSDVISGRTIAEFLKLVPHAEHRDIPDATHMVAGDANDRFTAVIAEYLQRHDPAALPLPGAC